MTETLSIRKYLRDLKLPFCPGCGIFTVMHAFLRAVHELGYEDLSKFVFCSGIGCSSWICSPYFEADSIHTPHGRSIPVATGIKLSHSDLNVVIFGGDGDIVGIGLSHFIHAARRNLDLTIICLNNFNYAMTGGQVAPTTPLSAVVSTMPYGSYEMPFNLPYLAESCGAVYVARWTSYHVHQVRKAMKEALQKKGFTFLEVLTPCPTLYERRNRLGDGLKRM